MGPLAALYGLLNKENEDAYQGVHRKSPHISREMFNTRLSPVFGRMDSMPSDSRDASGEPPIVLEDPRAPHMGMLEPESVWNPRKGLPPRYFRDPEQAGPSPPDREMLARAYGGK